jgi:hypothetical protein
MAMLRAMLAQDRKAQLRAGEFAEPRDVGPDLQADGLAATVHRVKRISLVAVACERPMG